MWTKITRPKYEREGLRYASALTDGEWESIEPFMPPARALGRPGTTDLPKVGERESLTAKGRVLVHAVSLRDRDGVLQRLGRWTLEIVKRSDAAKAFEVQPRRWVVERTLAWLSCDRRPARDFDATIASARNRIMIASVQLMTRRLSRA